jgi:hypothetical protein
VDITDWRTPMQVREDEVQLIDDGKSLGLCAPLERPALRQSLHAPMQQWNRAGCQANPKLAAGL